MPRRFFQALLLFGLVISQTFGVAPPRASDFATTQICAETGIAGDHQRAETRRLQRELEPSALFDAPAPRTAPASQTTPVQPRSSPEFSLYQRPPPAL